MPEYPEDPQKDGNPEKPVQSGSSIPEIKRLNAMDGLKWLSQSFNLFAKSPSLWIAMFVIYAGISLLLSQINFLMLLPTMLSPVFIAGFLYGAEALDNGQKLRIEHLFSGFKRQLRNLFRLGVLYFLINFLIITVISIILQSMVDETAFAEMMKATTKQEIEKILLESPELLTAIFKILLIGVFLSIPLIMASWFSSALVIFHQMPVLAAMLLSLKACNKNMLPFLVYGLLLIPLTLLALLPFGLGLLIILPVVFISQYCSYKMTFSQHKNEAGVFIV